MKKFYIFFILIALFILIFEASPVSASSFTNGLKNTGEDGAGYPAAGAQNPGSFLAKMIGNVLAPVFMGVIAMLILIYGGFTWMTARGDEQKVEKAKTIITNTIIAIIVVFSAYAIMALLRNLWIYVT